MALNTSADQVIEDRRAKAWELRVSGKSYRAIGKVLGVSVGTVHTDIKAAVAELRQNSLELAEEHRNAQLRRLDIAIDRLMPMVESGDEKLSLDAMDRLDKLERRRSALLGLDEPEKHSHRVDAAVTATPEAAAALVRAKFQGAKRKDNDSGDSETA